MASKKAKGKRYSAEEKQQILDFVAEVNGEKGRGGQSAAAKKFGISQLTISNWIKAGGSPAAAKKARRGVKSSTGDGVGKAIEKLGELHKEIASRRKELQALEVQFEELKAKI